MKKLTLLLLSTATFICVNAQINVSGNGFSYTQEFNTLDTNASNSNNLPTGWAIKETGTSDSANNMYRTGTGSTNAGDTYSFGSVANTDRALGSVASNSNSPSFGARFDNTSATDTITKIVVNYSAEQWRVGDTSSKLDTVHFMYSLVADSVGDTIAVNWIDVPSLMMSSVMPNAATNSGSALDGNTNFAMISDSFNVVIPPGNHIVIKWVDKNIVGSDDGLAVDDLSMIFKSSGVINGIANTHFEQFDFNVLGQATRSTIKLAYTAEAGKYNVHIYDLNGRVVYNHELQVNAGAQTTSINGLNLTGGLYIIKMTNGKSAGIVKAIIE